MTGTGCFNSITITHQKKFLTHNSVNDKNLKPVVFKHKQVESGMIDTILNLLNAFLMIIGALTILLLSAGLRDYYRCKLYKLNQKENH